MFQLVRYARCYDLSGYGAYLYGGRWNLRGRAVLYTAEARSLAIMEVLVHLTSEELPADMYLLTLDVPANASQTELTVADIPPDGGAPACFSPPPCWDTPGSKRAQRWPCAYPPWWYPRSITCSPTPRTYNSRK